MIKEKKLLTARYKENGWASFFRKYKMSSEAWNYLNEFKRKIENGTIKQEEHRKCPLCFNTEALLIAEIDKWGIPCETVICKGCGLVFNDSYFHKDSLASIYQDFFRKINFEGMTSKESFSKRTKPDAFSWKRFAFIALKLGSNLKNVNTIFEIGCRDGCNLLPFYLNGKEVVGCDYDDEYLNVGREQGLNLINGDVNSLIASGRKADLIILSHVFEHFIEPDREIGNIKHILEPGGYIYVEVPGLLNWNRTRANFLSEDGYRSGNNFLMYLQSVHNYCFDLGKISVFFDRNGFKLLHGDEWVRSIFINKKEQELHKKHTFNQDSGLKVLNYLRDVEYDFGSLVSQFYRIARKGIDGKKKLR